MRDQDRALSLAEQVLKAAAGADQAQVTVTISDASYARFARNFGAALTGKTAAIAPAKISGDFDHPLLLRDLLFQLGRIRLCEIG